MSNSSPPNLVEISIVIPCWGRAAIFQLIASQLFYIQDLFINKYKINIVACLSNLEDKEIMYLLKICEKYNINYCYHQNKPLGAKLNFLIKKAFSLFPNTDYIMNLGSDDLIHESLFYFYDEYIQKGEKYFGMDRCFFYEESTKKIILFQYKEEENLIVGAGRMLHKSIFKKIGDIYSDSVNSAMDRNSSKIISSFDFIKNKIIVDNFPYIVDIKGELNINSFNSVLEYAKEYKIIEEDIRKYYPFAFNVPSSLNSFNVEFGYELISCIPYAYWLYKNNFLEKTVSGFDTKPLYYFSPNHQIIKEKRSSQNVYKLFSSNVPNSIIHRFELDKSKFLIPPYKQIYKNKEYKWKKPTICICNRYNMEWSHSPINFFSIEILDQIFNLLKNKYQIIYFGVDLPENIQDTAHSLILGDYEFIKNKHKDILIFQDIAKGKSWNEIMLKIFANCELFITMNGGYSILASFFKGTNIIYSKPGKPQTSEIDFNSFWRWYPDFSNSRTLHVSSYEELLNKIKSIYMEKTPTVNILIRTSNRKNYLSHCIDSIYKQTYPNINIIINADDEESIKYTRIYKARLTTFNSQNKIEPIRPIGEEYGNYFPWNEYLDKMQKLVNGWILMLDDDDILIDPDVITKLSNYFNNQKNVIFWKVGFPHGTVPSNKNFEDKKVVCCDISGIGMMYHSSQIKNTDWSCWKRADYRTAKKLSENCNIIWHNEVLTKIQLKQGSGKRLDLDDSLNINNLIWDKVINLIDEEKNTKILGIGSGSTTFSKILSDNGFPNYNSFSILTINSKKKLFEEISSFTNFKLYNIIILIQTLEFVNDIEILMKLKSKTSVIFTVPNFEDNSHLRIFLRKQAVIDRYSSYMRISYLCRIEGGYYLVKGIMK